jgi:KUP system potassium uptake protein
MSGEAVGVSNEDETVHDHSGTPSLRRDLGLMLGALGVVFGDIGTSPLYAMSQSALAAGGATPRAAAVLGALSLIFWALVIVVTVKYVGLIMRADNNGEGGVLALGTLAHRSRKLGRRTKSFIALIALAGLALFYGDGILTPAISVLSAVGGIGVGNAEFSALVVPITLVILIALFLFQRYGTTTIGLLFGPVMVVWFIVIAGLGLRAILAAPGVFKAIDPRYGLELFVHEPWVAFVALGSVVLAVTGCEALYADMGHFGRRAITWAWLFVALPALILNYFGQGALLITHPNMASISFYALAPAWANLPLVVLATAATIIASQAVISGVFSITRQAVQLGQLPRMEIRHTSATESGQIYVPRINAMLCVGVVLVVLIFRTSDALASAYGIAVTGVMVISTALVGVVAYRQWRWNLAVVIAVFGALGIVDLAFLSSNALKIVEGGWLPLAVAAGLFMVMDTWGKGRRTHLEAIRDGSMPLELFLDRADKTPLRVPGTAVVLSPRADVTPGVLLHSLKHYKVLHERVILSTVIVEDRPFVPASRRIEVTKMGKGFFETKIRYGFFQTPDVPAALAEARRFGVAIDPDNSTFFVGRETLVAGSKPTIARWRIALYRWLSSNALAPANYFRLPPNRVVELGTQITI